MNLYLLYHKEDRSEVEEKLIPLFNGLQISTIDLSRQTEVDILSHENTVCITWLSDEHLRPIVTKAIQLSCKLVILPHPKAKLMCKALGLEEDLETIVESLKAEDIHSEVELLFCNDQPVFHSVKTGSIFEWDYNQNGTGLRNWINRLFTRLKSISELVHKPYSIFIDDEKLIETTSTGLMAIEHAGASVISRQWVSNEESNDGQFHFFIVSPQNLYDLFRYIFRNLINSKNDKIFQPDFIGYINTNSLKIKGSSSLKYLVDDVEYEAKELHFQVKQDAVKLRQRSIYGDVKAMESARRSVRIKGLPTGERMTAMAGRTIPWLPRATAEEFKGLFSTLREQGRLSNSYLVMMILSTLIATFGLYANSSPVIIGAMILAPLMGPIVSFSMAVVRYDNALLKSSFRTIWVGTVVSLLFAAAVSIFIPMRVITPEIQARMYPSLLDLGIAIASGVAAAYAYSKESIAQSLAGVAIAVALIPPLAVTGIGIGWLDWDIFSGAFLLYLTNLGGIILFGGISFFILGFTPFKKAGTGLLYSLLIVLVLVVPLSFTFHRIKEEARITQLLEGYEFDNYAVKDVQVRYGKPTQVVLKLITPHNLTHEQMASMKKMLEQRVERDIRVQVITAYEL